MYDLITCVENNRLETCSIVTAGGRAKVDVTIAYIAQSLFLLMITING